MLLFLLIYLFLIEVWFIWAYGSKGIDFVIVEWRQQGADMLLE